MFYKDISSRVNGVASKLFYLERGVLQSCPLSGLLFFNCYGAFYPKYKTVKRHQGRIYIQGSEEVRLTQYADDTDTILANVESVFDLFELLSLFELCSGLKINQTKLEMPL